jgi:hypothetical protein
MRRAVGFVLLVSCFTLSTRASGGPVNHLAGGMEQCSEEKICGTVLGERDRPLPGALVCQTTSICVATDVVGRFVLPDPGPETTLLYVVRDGYGFRYFPINDMRSELAINLRQSGLEPVRLPVCSEVDRENRRGSFIGESVKFFLPDYYEYHPATDLECAFINMPRGPDTERMSLCVPPNGAGFPPILVASQSETMTSRVLITEGVSRASDTLQSETLRRWGTLGGLDARGRFFGGERWRWISTPLQTISYGSSGKPTSLEAALYFDELLESLCLDDGSDPP